MHIYTRKLLLLASEVDAREGKRAPQTAENVFIQRMYLYKCRETTCVQIDRVATRVSFSQSPRIKETIVSYDRSDQAFPQL